MSSFLGKNLIGYRYKAGGDHFFYGFNPALKETLSTPFSIATEQEVNEACQMAEQAFEAYASTPIAIRKAFFERIVELIEENRSDLVSYFTQESGLPEDRANGELTRSKTQFLQYIDAAEEMLENPLRVDLADPARKPAPKPKLEKHYFPLGPVVVFGSSNFPFAYSTLGGDVASALAAGCPVIVKAHKMHPHTSSFAADLIRQAAQENQLPEGVFSHLLDESYHVGKQLVEHPLVQAVGFTGSISGGTALMKLAQNRPVPIPVYAEMGSVNPIVLLEDAMTSKEEISQKLADSVALNAGQFCTSPGFVFVPDNEAGKQFGTLLQAAFQKKTAQTMLHPEIHARFRSRVQAHEAFVEELVPVQFSDYTITPGLSQMTVSTFLEHHAAQEELFGSYLNLVFYNDENELLQCVSHFAGQLHGKITSRSVVFCLEAHCRTHYP